MIYLIPLMLGALFNALRGGQFGQWKFAMRAAGVKFDQDWKPTHALTWYQVAVRELADSDFLNAVAFGLAVTFVPSILDGHIEPNGQRGFYAALAMFAGSATGWGDYIGALGGWLVDSVARPLKEWPPIDKVIEDFKKTDPKKWGFYGLTLRGALWGFLLMLALNSFPVLLAGAAMGCVYWVGLRIKGRDGGWRLSEWIFGALLWGAALIGLALGV